MNRNSFHVVLGSLWTLASVLFFLQVLLPVDILLSSGVLLASAMVFNSVLVFAAGITRSTLLRVGAVAFHLGYPLVWANGLVMQQGDPMESFVALFVLVTSLVGAGVCDYGLYEDLKISGSSLESNVFENICFDSMGPRMRSPRPRAAYESGAFPRH